MLGVGYREVNQDQSSDPPALFRTSKAYSSLFSQYTLTAISAVSPDKALCVRVCVCLCVFVSESVVGLRNQEPLDAHVRTYIVSHMNSPTRIGRIGLISHLLT